MNTEYFNECPLRLEHCSTWVPEPKVLTKYKQELVVRTEFKFDLEKLRALTSAALRDLPPRFRENYAMYGGIGLQSAEGLDEYYDTVDDMAYIRARVGRGFLMHEFNKLNALGEKFNFVFETLAEQGIQLFRTRLLVARPGHLHRIHRDWDYRIHIPIFTNPRARAVFPPNEFHMEADGNAYFHNGFVPHTFKNEGDSDRIHLVGIIGGMYPDGLIRHLTGKGRSNVRV